MAKCGSMDIKSDHKTIRLFLRKEHKQNRQKPVDRTCMRSLGIRKIGHPVKGSVYQTVPV